MDIWLLTKECAPYASCTTCYFHRSRGKAECMRCGFVLGSK